MKIMLNSTLNLLYEESGRVFCDSLQVAEEFQKQHKNVLRDIAALDCSEEFRRLNFELSSHNNEQKKKQPMQIATRDGFMFLCMGYRGTRVAEIKESYIRRFNQMEAFIKSLQAAKVEFPALMDAICSVHDEPKQYHYTNELNILYRVVLGIDAKHYREAHDIPKGESIRPHLPLEQIKSVENLQRIDIGLIYARKSFDERKSILIDYHGSHLTQLGG